MEVGVGEVARRLGVSESRVRQMLRAGVLAGRRIGRVWVVPSNEVARLERGPRRAGRPLAPGRAWAVLDLLDHGSAPWLPGVARSQVRAYLTHLGEPDPLEWASLLRQRSRVHRVFAHPAALPRLERAGGVLTAGPAEASRRGFDLVAVGNWPREVYVDERVWSAIAEQLALREAWEPNLTVRVPVGASPFADHGHVGDVALAADLLEAAEPRAVTVGAAYLNERLRAWRAAHSEAAGWPASRR
ncbi:helix-turn-helix domain-containing protein [Janibacter sp. G368]|uniref:helix-turn-helix domain-containing protein n=1 Tax=Janibacter sp. G368 TaxID=3420441 RepID=UPI003D035DB4